MLNKKLAYLISSAAVLGSGALFPAFADQVDVVGNGAFSDTSVRLSNSNQTRVSQTNDTNISNNVRVNSNTGNNRANFNTGGDVLIRTGDVDTQVAIRNTAGSNFANLGGWDESCGCNRNTDVRIVGNGAFSNNSVRSSNENSKYVDQRNTTHFNNNVSEHSNTGYNQESANTSYNRNSEYGKHSSYNEDQYKRSNSYEKKSNYSDYGSNMKSYHNDRYSMNNKDGKYYMQKDNYQPHFYNSSRGSEAFETGNVYTHASLGNTAGVNFLY
jgi:hypothetical protein